LSDLNGATKSANETTHTKRSAATTNKGSHIIRSHIKKKQEKLKEEFLNSSMPIHLPTQQVVEPFVREPFVRAVVKSGGRKLTSNVMVNH